MGCMGRGETSAVTTTADLVCVCVCVCVQRADKWVVFRAITSSIKPTAADVEICLWNSW